MRELKPSDRVKIIGPWRCNDSEGGAHYIGQYATVIAIEDTKSVRVRIDDDIPDIVFFYDRESLRALPRRLA